jgi:hypothetical protein
MNIPNHKNRSSEQILSEHIFHDAMGFGFRAASWLDYAKRSGNFAAVHYACIDARLSIEHLLFEQLVITAGPAFTEVEYKRCLSESRKLNKLLTQMVPDYDKLLEFSEIVGELMPASPKVNRWDIKGLMKSWGRLSALLHWSGAHSRTTEDAAWQQGALSEASDVIEKLWAQMSTAQSGCIRVHTMPQGIREVWESFKDGQIDRDSAKVRLQIVQP